MGIEEIVKSLREQGLDNEAMKAELQEMLEKGEITEEDMAKAMEMLEGDEEKELAKKLYGDDLFD